MLYRTTQHLAPVGTTCKRYGVPRVLFCRIICTIRPDTAYAVIDRAERMESLPRGGFCEAAYLRMTQACEQWSLGNCEVNATTESGVLLDKITMDKADRSRHARFGRVPARDIISLGGVFRSAWQTCGIIFMLANELTQALARFKLTLQIPTYLIHRQLSHYKRGACILRLMTAGPTHHHRIKYVNIYARFLAALDGPSVPYCCAATLTS